MNIFGKNKKSVKRRLRNTLLYGIMLALPGIFKTGAFADHAGGKAGPRAEWTPGSYEIHLMLDSDLVLDEDHLLKREMLETFDADDSYKAFSLAYFETPGRDFFKEGWINRIRLKYEEDDENDFKLTYKKRYPVPEDDRASALRLAEKDGFDLSGETWESQIEWGYTGMTLSLSANTKLRAGTEKTIADLEPREAYVMMLENMPVEERDWKSEGWGSDTFASAEPAGPIFFKRYEGAFSGREIRIEVWTIHDERDDTIRYLSELSFVAEEYEEAAAGRAEMIDQLMSLGILLKENSLKTQQMLDAYLVGP